MQLIKPCLEILKQKFPAQTSDMSHEQHVQALEDAMYKHIELCGRTCYKSTDKITEDSAKPFVDRMIASQHYAMLEHGAVYLYIPKDDMHYLRYSHNKYSKYYIFVRHDQREYLLVTTNLRVIIENGWGDDLQYLCTPTKYHEKRHTVKFVSDIHFYKDITRHRTMSFAIESTRFCNYIRERFGISVNFAEPCWLKEEEREEFIKDCELLESIYFKWINKGWKAEEAAYFLCQGTKAEVIMTGFASDYIHFFDLRADGTTGRPHPTVQELAKPLKEEFIKRGFIYESTSSIQS